MQAVIEIHDLPERSLDAAGSFYRSHLDAVTVKLGDADTSSLVLVFPAAGPGHDDWRRTVARDLARAYAPKRVNVIAATNDGARDEMLAYLRNAPGVTGQYLQAHE